MILPRFQGTHVTRNAIGLLTLLCLADSEYATDAGMQTEEEVSQEQLALDERDFRLLPYPAPMNVSTASALSPARITRHRPTPTTEYTRLKLGHGQGLALRRVEYQANVLNTASVRAAERLRFCVEGMARWQRAVAIEKEGLVRDGEIDGIWDKLGPRRDGIQLDKGKEAELLPGWHSTVLSTCWDDWDAVKILAAMRPANAR